MPRRAVLLAALALGAGVLLAACGGGGAEGPVRVLAASSLAEVLPRIDPDASYSFAGSDELAAQLRQGAPGDVFVSASARYVDELAGAGIVEGARVFATNSLVAIVPAANPARIRALVDLVRPGVRLVLGAEGVPVGDYARQALAAAGLGDALANVVSGEKSAKSVVAKVALGEADAAIVFQTDANAAGDDVAVIAVPPAAQPRIEYVVAAVAASDRRDPAGAWIDRLLSDDGRAALRDAGFGAP